MRDLVVRLLADQRIRFLLIGGVNVVVGYGIFGALTLWVFHDVRFGYLLSLGVAYVISIMLAFVLYRRYVFIVTGNVLGDLARFVSVYAVSITFNALMLPLLVEGAGLPPLIAQAMVLFVTTLMSFFGHKSFSFRREDAP